MKRQIVVLAHDIRSTHNIGSLLRTAEGLGVDHVFITGYTPYPLIENDRRLPHEARKLHHQIKKTALGAETLQPWSRHENIYQLIQQLKSEGFLLAGLEQANDSVALPDFKPPDKLALVLGSEVDGISRSLLAKCDTVVEIAMKGQKESFNVIQAAAIALYHCTSY